VTVVHLKQKFSTFCGPRRLTAVFITGGSLLGHTLSQPNPIHAIFFMLMSNQLNLLGSAALQVLKWLKREAPCCMWFSVLPSSFLGPNIPSEHSPVQFVLLHQGWQTYIFDGNPVSNSGGTGYKWQPGNWLTIKVSFVVVLSPSRHLPGHRLN
jgi:hypothetical protein